jgi:hypothetical protein
MTDEPSDTMERTHGTRLSTWLYRNGWNFGVLLTVILAAAAGLRLLGRLEERADSSHERASRLENQVDLLNQKVDERLAEMNERLSSQLAVLENAKRSAVSEIRASGLPQEDPVVFRDGRLTSGYDVGVNTSGGRTDWLEVKDGMMCMRYPPGQQWGTVFITVGRPTQPPRASRNFLVYRSLIIEARGTKGGESVLVGLKDNTDPDDGSETKVAMSGLTTEWQRYEMHLSRFKTADLSHLYVPTEFVFEGPPTSLCVRHIEFLR